MKARQRSRSVAPDATEARSAVPSGAAADWWRAGLAATALLALVVAAYWSALSAGFVWDDDYNLTRNPTILSVDGLRQMWVEPESIQQYYPLMYTTFWVEYRLWGFDPLGYHLVNVAIHAVAVLLLWRLLVRLRVPGAWLAAAVFAVHPVTVESVTWVTERKNVLSLAFALAAMLCYARFAPFETPAPGASPGPARWRWYAAALVLFALALFSKTAVVTLPAVLLVIDWWKRGRLGWAEVAPVLPFFVVAVVAGSITVWMELYHCGARGEEWSLTPVERVLLAGQALWFYAGKLVWPHPLAFFYAQWEIDAGQWWQYLFPATAVALPVGLWLARGRIGRGPLAAVLIFGGVLMPVLGFVNVYYMQFAYVADHFQYHAAIALVALACAGGALAVRGLAAGGRRLAQVAAATLLVALGVLTFRQSLVYHDVETLYHHTLQCNPRCWMAYINLTTYLQDQDRYAESLQLLERCLAGLDEAHVVGKYNVKAQEGMGFLLMELDRHEEAAPHFEQALAIRPDDVHALYGLGMARVKSERWSEAQSCFERAVRLDPKYADGLYGLGVALSKKGSLTAGIRNFEKSLELRPADAATHFELANALALNGDLRAGEQHYLACLQLRPDQPFALHNLGVVLTDLGEPERALGYLQQSLRLSPDNPGTRASWQRAQEAVLKKRTR